MVLGLDQDSSRWLLFYFPVSWLTQFGHGLVTTVVGPTQPYLARNTGVDIDTINLVWSFGFFGYMVGSLGTSFIFKEYLKKDWAKLVFLAVTICVTGGGWKISEMLNYIEHTCRQSCSSSPSPPASLSWSQPGSSRSSPWELSVLQTPVSSSTC